MVVRSARSPNPRFGGREIDAPISRQVLRRPADAPRIGWAKTACTRPKTGVAMEREVDVVVVGAGPVGENVADRARAAGLEHRARWSANSSAASARTGPASRASPPAQRRRVARGERLAGPREAVPGPLDVAAVLKRRDYCPRLGRLRRRRVARVRRRRAGPRSRPARRPPPRRDDPEGAEPLTLLARHAVAVTPGSAPCLPPSPVSPRRRPWTSREDERQHVSGRLAILGGGVIAVEMATA